jgi:membrane fusion protein (multidrug efflux system)
MIANLLKKKRTLLAVALIIIIVIIAIVFFLSKDNPIPAYTVTTEPYTEKIIAVGQLGLEQEITLVAEVSGTVEKVTIKPGETINSGALLIQIESQATLEYASAKSEYDRVVSLQSISKTDYNNALVLYKEGAISKSDMLQKKTTYEAAVSQFRSAQLQVEVAQNNRGKYGITVPWDSVLLKAYVAPGDYARIGEPLAEIGSVGGYSIVAELDEKYFPYIKNNMPVLISVGDGKQGESKGAIDNITPQIDANTGTFEIRISVPKGFPYQASNLTVNLEILLLEKKEAMVIPQSYLVENQAKESDSESYVLVYENGKALKTLIETQSTLSAKVIVIKGLKSGMILISPESGIQDGD